VVEVSCRDKEQLSFIAHRRDSDGLPQTLEEHLLEVSKLAKTYAAKIGLESHGELIGLLHDLGKYSHEFQINCFILSE